ncbi:FKBP-type peptidyl-prolyl cis-trans isomerase [Haloarchaeobius sp. DFWS5]|uniref:FKBP-type peptidyl-prolyl cis-trans isomerase n=1 Tax=Haloarchaeobius sp. DFWS5 TaxID=3446114 RepID=UPI003EC00C9E
MTDDQEAEMAEQEDEVSEEAAEEEATEEETTGLQDGDFVLLEYTARTAESDQLVDTTDPEVAEEEGVDDEGRPFKPRTIVLGQGHMFEAVESEIRGKEVGDSGHVTIPAVEAFGEYDDEQVRTISAEKIPEDSRRPGAQVQIDGEQGYINTIIGGRARVDFNHPLAGEDLEYDYEIAGVVDDRLEKAQGLMDMFFDVDLDMYFDTDEVEEEVQVESDDEDAEPEFETETVEKDTLFIEATPQLQMNQQWMFGKQQVAQQLMQHLDVDQIVVRETISGGMGGMMGGMGGMMGGAGGAGGASAEDIEEVLEEADLDAEDIEAELDEE